MKNSALALVFLSTLALSGCETISKLNTATTAMFTNNQQGVATRKVASGSQQFKQGNFGLAQKDYLSAVEATPKNGVAWLGLAASYDQLGRFDLADQAYERLLKLEGRKPAILNNYGFSHLLRGNKQKAQSLINEARAQAPLNAVIEGNWDLAHAE